MYRPTVAWLALLLCSLSCSGNEKCEALAEAKCALLVRCDIRRYETEFTKKRTCIDRHQMACTEELNSAGTSLTADRIEACTQELSTAKCEAAFGLTPKSCWPFPGSVLDGDSCLYHSQCESTYCQPGDEKCGTCAPRAILGEACVSAGDQVVGCPRGAICVHNESGGTSKCTALAGESGDCRGMPCAGNLICIDGSCTALSGAGTACDATTGEPCNTHMGFTCDAASMQCIAMPVAKVGEDCGPGIACEPGHHCLTVDMTTVCVATAQDGEPCEDSVCLFPAECDEDKQVCVIVNADTCQQSSSGAGGDQP